MPSRYNLYGPGAHLPGTVYRVLTFILSIGKTNFKARKYNTLILDTGRKCCFFIFLAKLYFPTVLKSGTVRVSLCRCYSQSVLRSEGILQLLSYLILSLFKCFSSTIILKGDRNVTMVGSLSLPYKWSQAGVGLLLSEVLTVPSQ